MTDTVAAKTFRYTLAAGEEIHVPVNLCRYVRCTENSSAASFKVAIGQGDAWQPFTVGQSIKTAPNEAPFTYLGVWNDTAGSITIELRVGTGDFLDDRLQYSGSVKIENTAGTTVETTQISGDTFANSQVAVADSTATLLAATSATRNVLTVFNPIGLGGAPLYIGASGVNASNGFPVAPQATATIRNRAAIYAYQASGGSVDVPIVEES